MFFYRIIVDLGMYIFFSHGKESGPKGSKIQLLNKIAIKKGYKTKSIDYKGIECPELRIIKLKEEIEKVNSKQYILVGSSMGAYVSTVFSIKNDACKGLFLMAPAFYLANYEIQEFKNLPKYIHIIHAWEDKIVEAKNAIKFAHIHKSSLKLLSSNHRLSNVHEQLKDEFTSFLTHLETVSS